MIQNLRGQNGRVKRREEQFDENIYPQCVHKYSVFTYFLREFEIMNNRNNDERHDEASRQRGNRIEGAMASTSTTNPDLKRWYWQLASGCEIQNISHVERNPKRAKSTYKTIIRCNKTTINSVHSDPARNNHTKRDCSATADDRIKVKDETCTTRHNMNARSSAVIKNEMQVQATSNSLADDIVSQTSVPEVATSSSSREVFCIDLTEESDVSDGNSRKRNEQENSDMTHNKEGSQYPELTDADDLSYDEESNIQAVHGDNGTRRSQRLKTRIYTPMTQAKSTTISDTSDWQWERRFKLLVKYKKKHGNTLVPRSDPELGNWVRYQRRYYREKKLSHYRTKQLKSLGFVWKIRQTVQFPWKDMYNQLCSYAQKNNGIAYVSAKDKEYGKLGNWVKRQRHLYQKNELSKERIDLLESIGFKWRAPDYWTETYQRLVAYKTKHNNTRVPKTYKPDQKLANWIRYQRRFCKDPEKIVRLNMIGFEWDLAQNDWREMYNELLAYKEEHGDVRVPRGYPKLGEWVHTQRNHCRDKDRIELLDDIGFVWSENKKRKSCSIDGESNLLLEDQSILLF